MWKTLILMSAGMLLMATLFKAWTRLRRRQVLDSFEDGEVVRLARGVAIRAMVYGTRSFKGLNPRRANRTTGELILTEERFVVSTNRGLLVDLSPGKGRKFTSVRCTGPGRLIIEGDVPRSGKEPAPWRFEITVPDAAQWAQALTAHVRETEEGIHYATVPPWMRAPETS